MKPQTLGDILTKLGQCGGGSGASTNRALRANSRPAARAKALSMERLRTDEMITPARAVCSTRASGGFWPGRMPSCS